MVNLNKNRTCLLGLLILSTVAMVAACASGFSHFERRVSVSNIFENFELLPDHQYYYNGLPYSPNAVVAVRAGYTLSSPYWHAAEPTQRELRQWMQEMLNVPGAEFNLDPNGALILNDKGERIGVWYSVWDVPVLKFISATEFYIPNLMTIWPPGHTYPDM